MKYNAVLLAGIVGWGVAQILKFLLYMLANHTARLERLVGSGGMPSSHSAMVCAALVATGRICGMDAPLFGVMFIFAAIVMYDAMNVRQAAGLHAKILNDLKRRFADPKKADCSEKELKEFLGHTPLEVFCGALLGIALGFVVPV